MRSLAPNASSRPLRRPRAWPSYRSRNSRRAVFAGQGETVSIFPYLSLYFLSCQSPRDSTDTSHRSLPTFPSHPSFPHQIHAACPLPAEGGLYSYPLVSNTAAIRKGAGEAKGGGTGVGSKGTQWRRRRVTVAPHIQRARLVARYMIWRARALLAGLGRCSRIRVHAPSPASSASFAVGKRASGPSSLP